MRAVGRVGRAREHYHVARKIGVVDVGNGGFAQRFVVGVGIPRTGRVEDFVAVFDIVDDEAPVITTEEEDAGGTTTEELELGGVTLELDFAADEEVGAAIFPEMAVMDRPSQRTSSTKR